MGERNACGVLQGRESNFQSLNIKITHIVQNRQEAMAVALLAAHFCKEGEIRRLEFLLFVTIDHLYSAFVNDGHGTHPAQCGVHQKQLLLRTV